MAVEDDVIAFCEGPDEVDVLPGVVLGHALEILDERLLAVSNVWVVCRYSLNMRS